MSSSQTSSAPKPPPIVHINGFPCLDKLGVARLVSQMIPMSRVVCNHDIVSTHDLIPVGSAQSKRPALDYRHFHQTVKDNVLGAMAAFEYGVPGTWIIAENHTTSRPGFSSAKFYKDAADRGGRMFMSIVLVCDIEESFQKGGISSGENTRLASSSMGPMSKEEYEDMFAYQEDKDGWSLVLNVTNLDVASVARVVFTHCTRTPCEPGTSYPPGLGFGPGPRNAFSDDGMIQRPANNGCGPGNPQNNVCEAEKSYPPGLGFGPPHAFGDDRMIQRPGNNGFRPGNSQNGWKRFGR